MSRTEYAYTTGDVGTPTATFAYTYAEGWKDQLVSFNGQSIAYDDAGNPTTYRGASLSWTRGRLLASYNSITMQYDANGIRTKKVVPGTNYSTTTEFLYSGNNLLQEKVTVGVAGQASTTYRTYLYNSQGVMGFVQGGAEYIYHKNIFGDIVAIYHGSTKVAEYVYDAWGNHKVLDGNSVEVTDPAHIAHQNPFRYRGYYWDSDLSLYYLMSRYYDPTTGRFINADTLDYLDPESIGGLNLYAYCGNNPVMNVDPSGHVVLSIGLLMAIGFFVGAAVGAGSSAIGQYFANGCSWENFSWGQFALDTVLGGVSGLLSMSPLGVGAMIAANAGIGFVGSVGGHLINGSDFGDPSTWIDIGLSTAVGALVGLVGQAGALNSGCLNKAPRTSGFMRAASLYDDVLTKATTGFYKTSGIASNALRLSHNNLMKEWNKMIITQASSALKKSLIRGSVVSIFCSPIKGAIYHLYN